MQTNNTTHKQLYTKNLANYQYYKKTDKKIIQQTQKTKI